MNLVMFSKQAADAQPDWGGKAYNLAQLTRAGFSVPDWFVILPQAFLASLPEPAGARVLPGESHPKPHPHVRPAEPVVEAIQNALRQLSPAGELVAVRSSAADEDSLNHSFAGQLESFLFVSPDEAIDRVAAVWHSAFGERVLEYRRQHGIPLFARPPAVVIQRMVHAEYSGVAFSADPVTGRRGVAVVSAVQGVGAALVGGETDADTWRVNREGEILEQTLGQKKTVTLFDPAAPEHLRSLPLSEADASRPALTSDQVRQVAELARACARTFGCPQDIEWAMANSELYLLQSRPITSLETLNDPDGHWSIWDNSNIVESYSGITTPLTFSFARRAYEAVYRQFCRLMRVPQTTLETNDAIFSQMLGLIRGRVYYNLLSWYGVLRMLPGYALNRRFMEQMMGVKEALPEFVDHPRSQADLADRIRDSLRLANTCLGLFSNLLLLPRRVSRFYDRLNAALTPPRPPLGDLRPDELAACYRRLERQLLARWDAPLVNDFFAMIFHGLLRNLVIRWCGEDRESLANDLLAGEGGMISAEPALRLKALARLVRDRPDFVRMLCEGPLEVIQVLAKDHRTFQEQCELYLARFGDRCLEELKLESPTLHDNPLTFYRAVGQLARHAGSDGAPEPDAGVASNQLRQRALAQVLQAMRGHPLRRAVFACVLAGARARIRDRENLRFERTKLFGRVRRIFLALGQRWERAGLLANQRDIFYLQLEEVLGFVEGTASTTNLQALADVRKQEFAAYQNLPAPAERFETRGMVCHGNTFERIKPVSLPSGPHRQGLGCCPGIVRGHVRVVRDPRGAILERGEILVAERTDPGWILLFPAAAGIIVERGSLLSHSAIVARELGIPAIVSLEGAMQWLTTGEEIELDGSTGRVSRLDPSVPQPQQ